MNIDDIRRTFRTIPAAGYPELAGYAREQIYDGKMGPGGLYLAAQMARRLQLSPGRRVLDLGCGRGATSAFLARTFGVSVLAVDLWITASELARRFRQQGVDDRVVPLNLDITAKLPFAHEYFDAVFCMDSVHYYGGKPGFWSHLLPHLKPGGRLCIGSPCFNEEFTAEAREHLPREYDDGTNLWPHEFSLYHSPDWWKTLLDQTGLVEVRESRALEDGILFWEDDVLYNLDHGGDTKVAEKDADQYTFRQAGFPFLTHFVLHAVRKTVAAATGRT